MPTWPGIRVTRELYCSHHAPPGVWRPSRQRGCFISPADQRHTPVVGESNFSDIDEDDQENEAASQSSDIDVYYEAAALAAPSSPDVTVGTAEGATATGDCRFRRRHW